MTPSTGDKIEALKQDYYLRKARRERWEAFRAEQKERGVQKGFADYYKGCTLSRCPHDPS